MPQHLAQSLRQAIDAELPNLRRVSDADAAQDRGAGKWSAKEELGHLIDSACNNHIRFVLATVDGEFRGQGYAQDHWVRAHGYRDLPWEMLVDLWYRYNQLIAHLVERIPDEHIGNRCVIGWGVLTLRFVIEDYVLHMQHHLDHVLLRAIITPYPAVAATA
jgi:hypothetical protein